MMTENDYYFFFVEGGALLVYSVFHPDEHLSSHQILKNPLLRVFCMQSRASFPLVG